MALNGHDTLMRTPFEGKIHTTKRDVKEHAIPLLAISVNPDNTAAGRLTEDSQTAGA